MTQEQTYRQYAIEEYVVHDPSVILSAADARPLINASARRNLAGLRGASIRALPTADRVARSAA